MSDKKNVYAAFIKAQQAFAPALKQTENPHFKKMYVDLAGCVEAVIDALNTNGIGLMQRTYEDDTGVTVETVLIHESGEQIDGGKLHVPSAKQDPQGYGSALTYARRYSLMAACGIAPEDDDANAATAATRGSAKPPKKVPVDIKPYLAAMDAATSTGELKAAYKAAWEATEDDRTTAHFDKIVAAHADKIKAAKKTDPTEVPT